MKKIIRIIGVIILGLLLLSALPKHSKAQQRKASFQLFYDQLSPYGDWVNYADYGYVWIPDAGPEFVPYSTAGYWVFTDYGWTWMSDYKWGWAPFHYGRWDYNNYYGWFWVPDNEWGPSWVNWRESDGFYGWSPMRPGMSISFTSDYNYDNHNDHWIFVRDRDFERPDINRYAVDRTDHERIIRTSTVINTTYTDKRRNTTYVSGPARRDVQNVLGRKVKSVVIQENTGPGQTMKNGRLQIFRPQMVKNEKEGKKPAPWRITILNDAKRPNEKTTPVEPHNNPRSGNEIRKEQPGSNGDTRPKIGRGWPEQPVNVRPNDNKQNPNPVNVDRKNRRTDPVQPAKTEPLQPQPPTERQATVKKQERQEKAKESRAVEKPENNRRKR